MIDLSLPSDPEVLGYLKITGYSNYLHPYDENHVIGIGKETIATENGDFAWRQGVKVSLFDVSDVENPVEVGKIEIGLHLLSLKFKEVLEVRRLFVSVILAPRILFHYQYFINFRI